MARRKTGVAGGKISPRLPPVVRRPRENFSGYPSFIRIGNRRPPSAMIVTLDAPVNAVKNAQAITATMATPPGSQPTMRRKSPTRRFGVPPSAMR